MIIYFDFIVLNLICFSTFRKSRKAINININI